jgi:hypothetical protein
MSEVGPKPDAGKGLVERKIRSKIFDIEEARKKRAGVNV